MEPDNHESLRSRLADLLSHKSVQLGEFKLSSGQHSNFYIDARLSTMSAGGLDLIGRLGLWVIRDAGWRVDTVGGLTLGADPVAYALALASRAEPPEFDAFTVRKNSKRHGTGKAIEGCLRPGATALVVEDVITTGSSAIRAIEAVEASGATVCGVLAVVDRDQGGVTALESAGYTVRTLLTLADLGLPTE
ncbi:MAG: orotate phosphoribosyltransferase [Gemmatimonadales bacterium]